MAENFLAGNPATGNGGERFQVMVHVDQDPLAPDGVVSASDRVGSPPALPAAYHRGGVWGPFEGPHVKRRDTRFRGNVQEDRLRLRRGGSGW